MRGLMLSLAVAGFALMGPAGSAPTAGAAPLPTDRASCTKLVKSKPAYMMGDCKCICGPACGDAIRKCMRGEVI